VRPSVPATHRLEEERRRAVGPLGLEGEEDTAVGGAREALLGDWRPQDIPAELLERLAIVRCDREVGVQVEAVEVGLARCGRGDPGDARHAADLEDARPGAGPEGTPALHGRACDPGQGQSRLGEGIGRVALLRLAEHPPPSQEPEDAGPGGGRLGTRLEFSALLIFGM
jgi:hypothetical protein